MITAEVLAGIKVIWRQPDTLALWGIPYGMRPGQAPADLTRGSPFLPYGTPGRAPGPLPDWIWLGGPGWWGHLARAEQELLKSYLAELGDLVPGGPNEWSPVP